MQPNELLNGKAVPAQKKEKLPYKEFPKTVYSPTQGHRIVRDAEEEAALGAGWYSSPAAFPVDLPDAPAEEPEPSAELLEMNKRFNQAWDKLTAEHEELQETHASVLTHLAVLKNKHTEVVAENIELRREIEQLKKAQAAEAPAHAAEPAPEAPAAEEAAPAEPKPAKKSKK